MAVEVIDVGIQGPVGPQGETGPLPAAADILTELLTVDGAGSGLDADLLDGQSSAYYATAAADSEKLVMASNLSDVANAATAFGNIKQAATDSATGVVELATVTEANTGTDTSRAVTPAGVAPRIAVTELAVPVVAGEYLSAVGTSTAQAQAVGQLRLAPMWVPVSFTLVGLRAEITSGGSGGNTVNLLVYNADSVTGRPASLFKDGGTIDGTSVAVQEVTFTGVAMPRGLYWVGVLPLTGGAPTMRVSASVADAMMPSGNTPGQPRGGQVAYQGSLSAVPNPPTVAYTYAYPPTVLLKAG